MATEVRHKMRCYGSNEKNNSLAVMATATVVVKTTEFMITTYNTGQLISKDVKVMNKYYD